MIQMSLDVKMHIKDKMILVVVWVGCRQCFSVLLSRQYLPAYIRSHNLKQTD